MGFEVNQSHTIIYAISSYVITWLRRIKVQKQVKRNFSRTEEDDDQRWRIWKDWRKVWSCSDREINEGMFTEEKRETRWRKLRRKIFIKEDKNDRNISRKRRENILPSINCPLMQLRQQVLQSNEVEWLRHCTLKDPFTQLSLGSFSLFKNS